MREGDRREEEDHKGRRRSKVAWALEATIVTIGGERCGTGPEPRPRAIWLARARTQSRRRGAARVVSGAATRPDLGADRGYTQALPEHFHLPAGHRLQDGDGLQAEDLGLQANSRGAVLVDGSFYCPAMPEALVSASADHRAGTIDEATFTAHIKARASYRLVRKSGPDNDGYERYSCPAVGGHPHVVCPLLWPTSSAAVGKIPVLSAPLQPPKVCTQQAITIAPDVGARHRQELAFGTEEWARVYATCRNTIEGWNGYVKDAAHEDLAAPFYYDECAASPPRASSVPFCSMAANLRKIRAFSRARRRPAHRSDRRAGAPAAHEALPITATLPSADTLGGQDRRPVNRPARCRAHALRPHPERRRRQ